MKSLSIQQGMILALVFLFTACSSSKYDAMIVGEWHGVPSNLYIMKLIAGQPDTAMKQLPAQTEQEMRQFHREIAKLKEQGAKPEEISTPFVQALNEYHDTYVLKSSGKAGWTTPGGESGTGTWTVQRGGKQLVLSNPKTNMRLKMKIDSISRTRMILIPPDMPVEMKLVYTKE